MIINKDTAISATSVLLVPYDAHHVPIYHTWMLDPEILATTASEPLSLHEEYAMQENWRADADKITFVACLPLSRTSQESNPTVRAEVDDAPERMIGDINLFLTLADEDEEGCVGEIELMIVETKFRRKGHGRAAVLAFMRYLEGHLDEILAEFSGSIQQGGQDKGSRMNLLQLRVKIGGQNLQSIGLFESLGFMRVGEGENYFGEVELMFEGWLGKGRLDRLMEKYGLQEYREIPYVREKE